MDEVMSVYGCANEDSLEIEFVSFSYKNGNLIDLLKQRGSAIRRARDVDCFRKIDKLIDEEKEKLLSQDNHPVSAFVTFKTA